MTKPSAPSLSVDEQQLIDLYRQAGDEQQRAIVVLARAAASASASLDAISSETRTAEQLPSAMSRRDTEDEQGLAPPLPPLPSSIAAARAPNLALGECERSGALAIEQLEVETVVEPDGDVTHAAKRLAHQRRMVSVPLLGDLTHNPTYHERAEPRAQVKRTLLGGRKGRFAVLRASDDSMVPTVHPGDHVLVEYGRELANGGDELVLVALDGALALRRYIEQSTGFVHLKADNPERPSDVQTRKDQLSVEATVLCVLADDELRLPEGYGAP